MYGMHPNDPALWQAYAEPKWTLDYLRSDAQHACKAIVVVCMHMLNLAGVLMFLRSNIHHVG